ncbi:hypothetical protein [Williamsia soli]|uniref:hypothetical protein n=1 Tax=Williamsia soli TaxID=364929 RepID=UPI001A9E7CD7|nr:hypothetical protein [Williamsia soli]
MLPTRNRLSGWDIATLPGTGHAITTAGQIVEDAVAAVSTACAMLPEMQAWSGTSHDAAEEMFRRAARMGATISDYSDGIGTTLNTQSYPFGHAKDALLAGVGDIERGDLWVTDQWVVLIRPIPMTAEKAKALRTQQEHNQSAVNQLLTSVDTADDALANALVVTARAYGFVMPEIKVAGVPVPGMPGITAPADEVPSPATAQGLLQQQQIRNEDAAVTVRETTELALDSNGNKTSTITMQDGSKHVTTVWNSQGYKGQSGPTFRLDEVSVTHFDPSGRQVSDTRSWEEFDGDRHTEVSWADGTTASFHQYADGFRSGSVTTRDGRSAQIDKDSTFFTHPIPTLVGGAMTGIDTHVTQKGALPGLTEDLSKKVGVGAKFAGPAIGIGTTLYDTFSAANAQDACVAGISGTMSTGGSIGLGAIGARFGGPLLAAGGSVGGSWVFGAIGAAVGENLCR